MSLARPWILLLLLSIPFWLWLRRRRKSTGVVFSDVSLVEGVTGGAWVLVLPPALRVIAMGAWIIAAAGPRAGGTTIEQKKEGIAIMVAIDISSSMLAEDFAPSADGAIAKEAALLAALAGRIYDHAPQQNAFPLDGCPDDQHSFGSWDPWVSRWCVSDARQLEAFAKAGGTAALETSSFLLGDSGPRHWAQHVAPDV